MDLIVGGSGGLDIRVATGTRARRSSPPGRGSPSATPVLVIGLVALLGLGLGAPTLAAPPDNDEVAAAIVVSGLPFDDQRDVSEATPSADDPECFSGPHNPTVWYAFTPREAGRHGVSTFGSSYDTTLTVAIRDGEALEVLECNDDAGSMTSAVTWEAEAGREHLFMVGACCDSPGGRLVLAVRQDPAPDDPAFAVPLDLSSFRELRPRGEAGPLWRDATVEVTGPTGGWTNKVEAADIDGDGRPDILHANGGDYESPGEPERQAVFLNRGPGAPFRDATDEIHGEGRYLARVVKARDVTGDGIVDLLVGTTYQTQSRLLRGLGDGAFEDVTEQLLPQMELSVGDLEVGDVDDDRDMDIVLADWGPGSPMQNQGGPVRLWRNTGEGWEEDPEAMPEVLIGFSWDLELVDVDGDWDLDLAVSCKQCQRSRLYSNDGAGLFSDVSATDMPPSTNNYEFEAMDLDGDGDPELVTINDGPERAERVLRNDGGVFTDVTEEWWPSGENPGFDDNVIVFLDADSDGDADLIVGSLDGPDRLVINDGQGRLVADPSAFQGPPTPGTLGMAVADLDGDGRLDVVEGEGEVAPADHVFLATEVMAPDAAAPAIDGLDVRAREAGLLEVRARVHDRKTPVLPDDFSAVEVRLEDGSAAESHELVWYGDALWRAVLEWDGEAPAPGEITVCATDRAGNETCSAGGG